MISMTFLIQGCFRAIEKISVSISILLIPRITIRAVDRPEFFGPARSNVRPDPL